MDLELNTVMDSQISTKKVILFKQQLMWPLSDSVALAYYSKIKNFDFPETISGLLNQKRTVVQAGGHVGLYAKKYSGFFREVYTFEPESTNFFCLKYNTKNCTNVKSLQKCLGSENKWVSLDINTRNTGNHSISLSEKMDDQIECITLDSLNLREVDLIHLDVEGYEYYALIGAIETIKRNKPLIVLEKNRLRKKYHYKFSKIENLLIELGYTLKHTYENDVVYGT